MEINGEQVNEIQDYKDMGLSPALMAAIDKKGYVTATPIQVGAIPPFMEWKDVIAKAPTGTGKTFAFGIPMVEHTDPESDYVSSVVLAPTRELAIQIQDELRDLCAFKEGVRVVCLYGGQPIEKQITQLKSKPQIVVATPGRLMDHMKRRTVKLDKVQTVVLDEADRMLDMGFIRDVTHILDLMPQRKNLGMFSATISREVLDISWVYQREPVEITVQADQENRPDIAQYRLEADRGEKADIMARLLEMGDYERVIAFCNTKNMTDRLAGLLDMRGISCEPSTGISPSPSGSAPCRGSGTASCGCWPPPTWPPGGWTSTMWTPYSTTTSPTRTSTTSTASAAPAGHAATGWPSPWWPPSPRACGWTTL